MIIHFTTRAHNYTPILSMKLARSNIRYIIYAPGRFTDQVTDRGDEVGDCASNDAAVRALAEPTKKARRTTSGLETPQGIERGLASTAMAIVTTRQMTGGSLFAFKIVSEPAAVHFAPMV
jgi:hypothetical protein